MHGIFFRRAAVVLLLMIGVATPASAQGDDISAVHQRYGDLYDAVNYPAALTEARKLEALVKARYTTNHPNYAIALESIADVYEKMGRYGEAEEHYKRVLTIREKLKGVDHPDVAQVLLRLGIVEERQAKYDRSEERRVGK